MQAGVEFGGEGMGNLWRLYQLVKGWRGTVTSIEGPSAELRQRTFPALYHKLDEVVACHSRCPAGRMADMYCSCRQGPGGESRYFGCRIMEGLQRLPGWQYDPLAWWDFGTLSEDLGTFRVGKLAVREYLLSRAPGQICSRCPAFSTDRILLDVESLPAAVELGESSRFRLKYSLLDPARPVGIEPKPPKNGFWDYD